MNKLIAPSIIVAAGMVTAAALSQQAGPPASGFQAKPYFQMPLEKDPSRVVRLQNVVIPPGAGNQFHRHPGDQWWAVQEGEVTFTVKGQQPRVMKPGEFALFHGFGAPKAATRVDETRVGVVRAATGQEDRTGWKAADVGGVEAKPSLTVAR